MTHSRIPKYTKLRPFGSPQTPFDVRTGRYLPLSKELSNVKAVVIEYKLPDEEQIYLSNVLDSDMNMTGEQLAVRRLIYGDIGFSQDITINSVLMAFKVNDRWYVQDGYENAPLKMSDAPYWDYKAP